MSRLSTVEYFFKIALAVAERSTCPRGSVGTVLAKDGFIVSTGYNGSSPGLPHCDEVGCDIDNGHCVRVLHSEENSIIQAAKLGHSTKGAAAYVTMKPCFRCAKMLRSAGIVTLFWLKNYDNESDEDKKRFDSLIESCFYNDHKNCYIARFI